MAFDTDPIEAEAAIVIDGDAPVTEAAVQGEEGEAGWYISDVTVSLDATDESSGVGLTEYMVNGSEWSTYVDQFGLSDDGTGSAVFMADTPLWEMGACWNCGVGSGGLVQGVRIELRRMVKIRFCDFRS